MTKIRQVVINKIKEFEGFSPLPYQCPGGYWTVGYGHVLSGPPDPGYQSFSCQEADGFLEQDIQGAEKAIQNALRVPLTQNQYEALVSFVFNVGAAAFQRSSLRQKVNRQEHQAAAEEFKRWIWSGGRQWSGLIRRRAWESYWYNYNS